jgi:hypothetical protein
MTQVLPTSVVMFQSLDADHEQHWLNVRELMIRANEMKLAVMRLDAHKIDIQKVLDEMESDRRERITALLEEEDSYE